jgi:hypothetical protein
MHATGQANSVAENRKSLENNTIKNLLVREKVNQSHAISILKPMHRQIPFWNKRIPPIPAECPRSSTLTERGHAVLRRHAGYPLGQVGQFVCRAPLVGTDGERGHAGLLGTVTVSYVGLVVA